MYRSFRDFYPFYLSQHRRPLTRALHIFGLFLVFVLIVVTFALRHWWLLFLIPVVGYGPAWVGHFFFEKNRPATFQYPLYSLLGDLVMFKDTFRRKKLFLAPLLLALVSSLSFGQEPESLPSPPTESSVRFTITNGGVDVGDLGIYTIYPVGHHDKEVGHASSGEESYLAPGTYDVRMLYRNGTLRKEQWLLKKDLTGAVDQTIEMNAVPAQVVIHVTRFGQPVQTASCGLYEPGERGEAVAKVEPEETATVAEGHFDVGCVFDDQGLTVEQWKTNQPVVGQAEIAFTFDFRRATFRVIDPPNAPPPIRSLVQIYPPGTHQKTIARGAIGSPIVFPAGTYDIVIQRDQRTVAWRNITIDGYVSVPLTDAPPAAVLKDVRIPAAPETLPLAEKQPPESRPIAEAPLARVEFPPGPQGLPGPPNLTNVPFGPINWHTWFGCNLIPEKDTGSSSIRRRE